MVLVVRQEQRERRWQREGMDYSLEVVNDIWMVGTALSVGLVFTGILIPSFSISRIWASAWRAGGDLAGESRRVADALGVRESPGSDSGRGAVFAPLRAGGLPTSRLIGSGEELAELPVMEIEVELMGGVQGPDRPGLAVRYYWRALTYDRYSGRGWASSPVETWDYGAGEAALDAVLLPGQRQTRQRVQLAADGPGVLYAAGTPLAADKPFSMAWRVPPDDSGAQETGTAPGWDLFGASVQSSEYRVDSLVAAPSAARLREASGAYPDWVLQRYLTLPEELPDRVFRLARRLTAGEAHPYDQARAIETYLRRIPYTLDLPAPPQNKDVVDYFLFELQRGYCDYYATAMVVLARASGLPSRLVMGYAQGTPDESGTRFFISQADAHSWVEIYLPGWGWVEFEPTGGLPPLERPAFEAAEPLPEFGTTAMDEFPGLQPPAWRRYAGGVLAAAALGVSGLLLVWRLDLWRLGRLSPAGTLLAVQRRMRRHGRRLAVAELPGQTPYEYSAALLRGWLSIVRLPPESQATRETGALLGWLVERYALAVYSRHRITHSHQKTALQYWRRLQRRLWRAQALRLWSRIIKERR
jgi:transglutaminase-like putative cysteine protease